MGQQLWAQIMNSSVMVIVIILETIHHVLKGVDFMLYHRLENKEKTKHSCNKALKSGSSLGQPTSESDKNGQTWPF